MQIIIDNKPAVLKKSSSFEFVAENRYFTGSDSYTFSITLPLKGCRQNREIFGNIDRMDVEKNRVNFDCEIIDKNFHEKGIVTITDISETEVKVQFLEGKCIANYNEDLEDIYINELELGNMGDYRASQHSVQEMMRSIDAGANWVALPFVNNSSGNIINELDKDGNGNYIWKNAREMWYDTNGELRDADGVTCQPYLIYIAKKICEAAGYSYDFTAWEQSDYRHLIICNVLPSTWASLFYDFKMTWEEYWENYRESDDEWVEVFVYIIKLMFDSVHWQHMLPHWSIQKFFDQVGYLINGTFNLDINTRRIDFNFNRTLLQDAGSEMLDNVIDVYSVNVNEEEDEQYIDNKVFEYKEGDYSRWDVLSCTWFIQSHPDMIKTVDTLSDLFAELDECKKMTISDITSQDANSGGEGKYEKFRRIYFVDAIKTYFMLYNWKAEVKSGSGDNTTYYYYMVPKPVNVFGVKPATEEDDIRDDDRKTTSLEIVPVRIDNLDLQKGDCMFIEVPSSDELEGFMSDNGEPHQPTPAQLIEQGQNGKNKEYYSTIQVAFWNGEDYFYPYCPRPIIDRIDTYPIPGNSSQGQTEPQWARTYLPFSLRLYDQTRSTRDSLYPIASKIKYTIKFLRDDIPNPRALFYIKGQKYICKKMTVTFTENGRSRLIKGEFYKLANK